MRPAVFLDRDGVIIANRADYVKSWQEVLFLPGALAALERLEGIPELIVIVTNQSAVGRGLLTLAEAHEINEGVASTIREAGGRIDGLFLCPHAPWQGCGCRKPEPGLLLQAARELNIDLSRSTLIGDALTDLQAAEAAGVPRRILVLTGRGQDQLKGKKTQALGPFEVASNLADAVEAWVLGGDESS